MELQHYRRGFPGRLFNQDNIVRNPFMPLRGNNLANVQNIIQQLMELPQKRKDPQVSRMHTDGDVLTYSDNDGHGKVGVYISGNPLTPYYNYFEFEILDTGANATISIGLTPRRYPMDKQPGWNSDSVAYHMDDGRLYKANGRGRQFGHCCEAGDIVGCGIKFEQVKNEVAFRHVVPVFFTKNGKEIGTVLTPMPQTGFYPAVGMHSEGEEVRISLERTWECKDDILMSIDNIEDEWARLNDVRLNGQILEYTGRGKSIADVGLAQARYPLDPAHHYFEIEIVDPGENCYVAIGLARKDYPLRRHPGWNKGSIAYHADDGKIFMGSGIGDPFGPKCNKGDVMGCGILFPRDYNTDPDTIDSSDLSEGEDIDDYIEVENYHSDDSDEYLWGEVPQGQQRPAVAAGQGQQEPKVQVFFTKNGKCVGRRDCYVAKGGFFPTVGMLSSFEKVRVDLRPLTG